VQPHWLVCEGVQTAKAKDHVMTRKTGAKGTAHLRPPAGV